MKPNTETAQGGTELYTNAIYKLVDEYIDTLDSPDDIRGNTAYFNGMIKYVSRKYFKKHPIKDYGNIEYIDSIWDIYTSLCYKYNKYPTIIEFCLLINISRDTLHSWKNSDTRCYKYYTTDGVEIRDIAAWKLNHQGVGYVSVPSSSHSDTVKKWLSECESSLLRGAAEGSRVGCIFALKANYGYTETAPIPTVNLNQHALADVELPRLGSGNCMQIVDNSAAGDCDNGD